MYNINIIVIVKEITQCMPLIGDADCPIQTGLGVFPVGCELTDTPGARNFNNTACDNTVCDQCTEDASVTCCCSAFSVTGFDFMCEGESPRTFYQPDQCTCQPCENVAVQLVFQVLSSSDGQVTSDAQLIVTDSTSSSPSSLTIDSAGFFSTFRQVNVDTVTITASASGHASREFIVTVLPPGPHLFIVTLSAFNNRTLGSNVNMSLDFPVDGGVNVMIPPNSVVTSNNQAFTGDVIVRTFVFSANQATYSDELPPEITTMDDGGREVFYETRVLARAQLVDDNGNGLNVTNPLSLSINFDDFDFEAGTTVSVLFYNGTTNTWSVLADFTVGSRRKRQLNSVELPDPNSFWAVATAVNISQICYLQVQTFERDDGLNGVTVSSQQSRGELFFRGTGMTDNTTGPVPHSACIEVLCGYAGTVEAEFNSASIVPMGTQPSGITVSGNTITFNTTTEGSPSTPFYNTEEECRTLGSDFVSFEVPLEPPSFNVPPVVTPENFWFIRAEVLSCFDSNMVTTLSVDSNGVTSVASMNVLGSATGQVVNIPTLGVCNGRVTRRTVCIEAYANSMVTLEVQPHPDNTEIGPLCYLSELTNLTNSATRTNTSAQLDLTTLTDGNPMAGLYFGDTEFLTQDQCLNPSSENLDNPLQGFFAQFDCFERKF